MSVMVVDASVAAKWFLPKQGETLTDEALEMVRCHTRGEILFIVTDLFWAEVANIFWKTVRQGRCAKAVAETALASLQQTKLTTVPSQTLLKSAFGIATAFDRTVYDGLYVAVAVLLKIHLITADQRLVNALAATLPVKWLGAL